MAPSEEPYANVREFLGSLIGKTLIDVTQHDIADFERNDEAFVMLMFDDGSLLKFDMGDDSGFVLIPPGVEEG